MHVKAHTKQDVLRCQARRKRRLSAAWLLVACFKWSVTDKEKEAGNVMFRQH
jgi:hypothetical protein